MSEPEPAVDGLRHGRYQGYTVAEMEATDRVTRNEDPRWRWLFPVTRVTRDFITGHFAALQASYLLAVAFIYLAAYSEASVEASLLDIWLAEALGSFLLRWMLMVPVERASPVAVAQTPLLRLIPLFAIVLASAHWTWTATIFVGDRLDLTTFVTLLSFVMLSISVLGISPAMPGISVVYLVPMWSVTAFQLLRSEGVSVASFVLLMSALAAALWSAFFIVLSGVRRYLVRGDENALLVDKLRQRNDEVERLRAAAGREFESRSTFFTSASHDFRQRVHAMKLLARSAVDPSEDGRSALHRLSSVVEDLEDYMTDVLEFARLESASLEPQRQVFRLQVLFQQIDVQFEDVAASRGVELRVRPTASALNSDPRKVLRILENLVTNSLRFTRRGVLVSARRRGGQLWVEVRDQGPGISDEGRRRVFDAFYQGDEGSDRARDGVGLGLAIVKRLSDALGYAIEVHSRLGRGTLMRLVIPSTDVC